MRRAFSFVFKALAWALMIVTPLLGIWVASSLAAYANARVGWVVASGLLLFPVLPLAWVGLSEWRRRARGDFIRQPMMQPAFYARGLKLDSPDRSQVDVNGRFDVRLENASTYLLAYYVPVGSEGHGTRCMVNGFAGASCDLPAGKWDVLLYGSSEPYGEFDHLGTFEVNSR